MGFHFLLQGIFPIQGLNLSLLHFFALAGKFFTTEPPGKPWRTKECVESGAGWMWGGSCSRKEKSSICYMKIHVGTKCGHCNNKRVFRLLLQRLQRFKGSQQKSKWKLIDFKERRNIIGFSFFLYNFIFKFILLIYWKKIYVIQPHCSMQGLSSPIRRTVSPSLESGILTTAENYFRWIFSNDTYGWNMD